MTITNIVHAILLASDRPLTQDQLIAMFDEHEKPTLDKIDEAITELTAQSEDQPWQVKKVASGFRIQVRQEYANWVGKLWEERPVKYSRALLETLALVAYRQPITRSEIEDIRGVSVSSNIMRTLQDRGWIRVVGHREVPGRPAIFATTKAFLDYFDLDNLADLPELMPLRDLDQIEAELGDAAFSGAEDDDFTGMPIQTEGDSAQSADRETLQ